MSLIFAAITPHPPLLIPTIGKDKAEQLKKTQEAMAQLEQELYLAKPDVIMVISPHGSLFTDAFTINAHNTFKTGFDEFGDLVTEKTWKGAPTVAARIAHEARHGKTRISLISEEKLDHGASVPLYHLTNHLPNVKVLPVGFSHLDPKDHLDFGEMLKEVVMEGSKRVAVIASGDLSHEGKDNKAACETFDKALIDMLETRNTVGIAGMDQEAMKEINECGYRSILILLGLLKETDYTFKNYCYEAPLGVGYLTGNFQF